jgi:beta-glucosidase
MSSYSCVDGLPGSGSAEILTGLLRGELGFDGLVVADYFAVSLLVTYHRVAADRSGAAVKALTAGLDLELPALDCYGEPLREAVAAGLLPIEIIDTAVRRVLTSKFRLGLFESPFVDTHRASVVFEGPANAELARKAAVKAVVMLANDGVLPLSPALARLAVIGPAAEDRRLLQGDYHYPAHQEPLLGLFDPPVTDADSDGRDPADPDHAAVDRHPADAAVDRHPADAAVDRHPADAAVDRHPADAAVADLVMLPTGTGAFKPGLFYTDHVTPLAGLRAALGDRAHVVYEKGCEVDGTDRSGFPAAVRAAAAAEVAIVFVGGRSGLHRRSTVGEARDATDLRLTGVQGELVAAVAGTGTPTVVVVVSGRAHQLTEVAEQASALLVAWPLGEQGGHALAHVLTGRAEPGGRLPVSLPRATGQVPIYHSQRSGGARSMFYGDYTDSPHTPLFCFGHGLGYTTFEYSELLVRASGTTDPVTVEIAVTNTGQRSGEDVVQLYVSDLVASVARPEKSLIGFARLALEAGRTAKLSFDVHPSRLAFYDDKMRFVVEPGEYRFAVGTSSSDLRQQVVVRLAGDVTEYRQRSVVPVSWTLSRSVPAPGPGHSQSRSATV